MELDLDLDNTIQPVLPSRQSSTRSSPSSSGPSPPETPISTPLSPYASPRSSVSHHLPLIGNLPFANYSPFISAPPSPPSTIYDPSTAASTRHNSPNLADVPLPVTNCRTNLNIALASGGFPRANPAAVTHLTNPEEAFNVYARFASDYSSTMPGAQFNAASCDEASALNLTSQQERQLQLQQQDRHSGCVPPALLFASTASASASRVSNPAQQGSNGSRLSSGPSGIAKAYSVPQLSPPASAGVTSSGPGTTSSPGPSALSATRPPASLLLSKPFKCPKPNCNKSYKQANGLKYHLTHGSCNFAPPKDLEHVKDLLERKRREKNNSTTRRVNKAQT
jgi:transcription factor SFP1